MNVMIYDWSGLLLCCWIIILSGLLSGLSWSQEDHPVFVLCVFLLTGEVDWLPQMHHGDVSLFSKSVVLFVDDDVIDPSDLNIERVLFTLRVKTENSRPWLEVDVLPVKQKQNTLVWHLWSSFPQKITKWNIWTFINEESAF